MLRSLKNIIIIFVDDKRKLLLYFLKINEPCTGVIVYVQSYCIKI